MTTLRTALYGVVIWAIVLAVAILAFPLRGDERPLFESIMPVALALAVTVAAVDAFRREPQGGFATGVRLGLSWLAVNLLLDALAFSRGPMQMSLADYAKDIGLTYAIILVIPAGIGRALEDRLRR